MLGNLAWPTVILIIVFALAIGAFAFWLTAILVNKKRPETPNRAVNNPATAKPYKWARYLSVGVVLIAFGVIIMIINILTIKFTLTFLIIGIGVIFAAIGLVSFLQSQRPITADLHEILAK